MNFNQQFKKNKCLYFSYYFKQYIQKTVHNIHHPEMIKKWNSSMDKAAYEFIPEKRVRLSSERSALDRRFEKRFWQKNCEEVIWFEFQGVMKHEEYKMKDSHPDLLE